MNHALLRLHPVGRRIDGALGAGYGIFGGTPKAWAVLKFTKERARWVEREVWHAQQESRTEADGRYVLSVPYSDDREILGDIMPLGADVEVLEPRELRRRVQRGFLEGDGEVCVIAMSLSGSDSHTWYRPVSESCLGSPGNGAILPVESHTRINTNVNAPKNSRDKLDRLGFSHERGGVHTARTMMLAELRALLSFVDAADAAKAEYLDAIQTANCLGKRSGRTRALTFRHLADLYALDPSLLVFRALRFFWQRDVDGQPLLAALCAYSRDPILRATAPFVLGFQEGATVTREGMEEFLDAQEPGRFSKATLKSTAQNLNSSWTQSGHLAGRVRKVRARAAATPGAASLALLMGYVSGLRGESLFKSDYTRMLDCSFERTLELAEDASRRGWISLKRVGQVIEVLFPNLITAQEMEWLREQN